MPKTLHDFKTVGEQTAFDFGAAFKNGTEAQRSHIARRYAFTHQYSVFPRSNEGYARLRDAFLSGAGEEV